MPPLTWKNVTYQGSSAAGDVAKLAAVIGNAGKGIGDAFQGVHDRKSDEVTGQGLAQIMAMDDYENSGQQAASIMAGLDPRYADMTALSEAGVDRGATLRDNKIADFEIGNMQETYDLNKQLLNAQIDARKRQYTGTKSGKRSPDTQSPQDQLLAIAEQQPGWDKLSQEEKWKQFTGLAQSHKMGSLGTKYAFENRYGYSDDIQKAAAKAKADNKKGYKAAKLLTAPDNLNAPNFSIDNDRDAKANYNSSAEYLQRKLKMKPNAAQKVLNAGYNTGLNLGGIFGPLSGGGWDKDDDSFIEAMRDAEDNFILNSTQSKQDQQTIQNIQKMRTANG